MDESCSALDPIATMKIEELLQTLRDKPQDAISISRVGLYGVFP
jgi:ABC-type phosphate transport system ATPase subunit